MTRPISGLSSMATRALLADVAAAFQAQTGAAVAFESVGGVDAARRVRAGEPVEIVVLAAGAMAALEAEGHLLAGSRVDVARSPMAMAVPAGRPRPDLADGEAVRRATLGAGRIAYSTGPSGDHLKRLWQEWGIADALADRLVQAPPGVPVGTLLARREAEIGFQQLSELTGVAGIDIVGPLPSDLGTDTIFTAGLARAGARPDEARAFLLVLASREADAAKRARGMEPTGARP